MLISNKIHYFRNFYEQIYEKKCELVVCYAKKQAAKITSDYEIDFFDVCLYCNICFGEVLGPTADYDAIGRDRIKGGV